MDKLQDPWMFAGASSVLIGIATYVWAQFTDKQDAHKQGGTSFVIALLSLLLLTFIVHSQPKVLTDPFA